MDPRFVLLSLPSAVALSLLAVHSRRALGGRRATIFWSACVAYGTARGLAVRWITETGLGGAMPYAIRDPLFTIAGVSLQEIAGWAIVAYLGWWLGHRLAAAGGREPRLFAQVAWAVLWLAAISWAVEATAIAAGWWSWRIPVVGALPGRVPPIGLVDWAFVGLDFLLPVIALTAPALRTARWRAATLLLFPLHFAGHLVTERVVPGVPVPGLHIVHWLLGLALLWAALRHGARDRAFADSAATDRLAFGALGIVLVDLALVQTAWLGRAELLVSLAPAAVIALLAASHRAGLGGSLLGVALAPWQPALLFAAVPTVWAALLRSRRTRSAFATAALVAVLAGTGWAIHARGARAEHELVERLDRALRARDAGDLEAAITGLHAINDPRPSSHAAAAFEGEIQYRLGRLDDARRAFELALRIKDDDTTARRHLAVIALRDGRSTDALALAARGVELDPDDLQLRYLRDRAAAIGGAPAARTPLPVAADPGSAAGLAALAFEIDDRAGAAAILDRAIDRWPSERALHDRRLRVALASGETDQATGIVRRWLGQIPGDPVAREHALRLGVPVEGSILDSGVTH